MISRIAVHEDRNGTAAGHCECGRDECISRDDDLIPDPDPLGPKNDLQRVGPIGDPDAMPDPGQYANWGRWSDYASAELEERDHLFQVANITRNQIKALGAAGIETVSELAGTELPHVGKLSPAIFEKLKSQARIQSESLGGDKPKFEVLSPSNAAVRGLALLPPHSDLDVFFDIEGFPLVENYSGVDSASHVS